MPTRAQLGAQQLPCRCSSCSVEQIGSVNLRVIRKLMNNKHDAVLKHTFDIVGIGLVILASEPTTCCDQVPQRQAYIRFERLPPEGRVTTSSQAKPNLEHE